MPICSVFVHLMNLAHLSRETSSGDSLWSFLHSRRNCGLLLLNYHGALWMRLYLAWSLTFNCVSMCLFISTTSELWHCGFISCFCVKALCLLCPTYLTDTMVSRIQRWPKDLYPLGAMLMIKFIILKVNRSHPFEYVTLWDKGRGIL